jgi:hypothetical protein
MIVLDFAEDRDLWREVPVRLRLGDVEILGWDGDEAGDAFMLLPLVPFAVEGLLALRQVRRHGYYFLELGRFGAAGDLLFARRDDDVLVHDPHRERTGRAPLAALEAAWAAFADRVAAAVRARAPELTAQLERLARWRTEDPPWLEDPCWHEAHWRERFDAYGWRLGDGA